MATDPTHALAPLFEPIALGGVTVANRIAMTAHNGALPPARYLAYLRERAQGGVGLVIAAGANIGVADYSTGVGQPSLAQHPSFDALPHNPASAEGIGYYDDVVIPLLRERAEVVHSAGARCFGQVYHLGAYKEVDDLRPAIAPSPRADEEGYGLAHELESFEIEELVIAHAHSVRRVQAAGLDGAEIHAGHGFLINAFLSPLTNHRDDAWGGDLGGRARFLEKVITASRGLVGTEFPIGLRISGIEEFPGGLTTDDVIAVCRSLQSELAYVSITAGSVSGLRGNGGLAYASSRHEPRGHNLSVAARVKAALEVPIIVAGRMLTPAQAADAITCGACDLVGMVRALIADPEWVAKARTGRTLDIRPCISANECHGFHGTRAHMVCAINARAGREVEPSRGRSSTPSTVVVVGGGPAGLEAAAVAAERGHLVVLFERSSSLGGQLNTVARDPSQARLVEYVAHCVRRVHAAGVAVHLETDATVETVLAEHPEVVIVATGSDSVVPNVRGLDEITALTATDVLNGAPTTGDVLVVAGFDDHLTPLAIADLLVANGHAVEVLTERLEIAEHADRINRVAALRRAVTSGIRVTLATGVERVENGIVVVANRLSGCEDERANVSTLVFTGERVANVALARELRSRRPPVHVIGDAHAPRRIIHAVLDGHRAGEQVGR